MSGGSGSGRERALEALIDREPHGDRYRVARVLDEAVPIAQSSRPNLVTKAALVEQAFALSKYDIDSVAKYDQLMLNPSKDPLSEASTKKIDGLTRERIFHYQTKIVYQHRSRSSSSEDVATPPPAVTGASPPASLVAALRRVYDEAVPKETDPSALRVETSNAVFELRQLLESLSNHSVFAEDSAGRSIPKKANLDALLLSVCKLLTDQKDDNDEASLQGLLIAILSLLPGQQAPETKSTGNPKVAAKPAEPTDDVPFQSAVQVGALLSLLPTTKSQTEFCLDPKLLEYFGAAAVVYEERLEIQKARMLARLETPPPVTPPTALVFDDLPNASAAETLTASGNVETPDAPAAEAVPEASAVPGENEDEEQKEPYESSSDGADDDVDEEDDDESMQSDQEDEEESSDSASSSESSGEEDGATVDPDALDTDEEDGAVLRHAVALSVTEQEEANPGAFDVVETHESAEPPYVVESPVDVENNDESVSPTIDDVPPPETPVSTTSSDGRRSSAGLGEGDEPTDLPSFPKPPSVDLLSFLAGSSGAVAARDPDNAPGKSSAAPLLNPSDLSCFSSVPASYVLFHLLQFTDEMVEQRLYSRYDSTVSQPVVAGGMCSSLFGASKGPNDEANEAAVKSGATSGEKQDLTLQLLIAALFLTFGQRNEAIENLRKAMERKRRLVQGGDEDREGGDDDSTGTPLPASGEEDDPALTLAMNYIEDDVPLSSESLENKGMRRKAAAAAHDSALLLRSLQKRTEAWKSQVALLSSCVARLLKVLRQFLQCVVRSSLLHLPSNRSRANQSVLQFHAYLPLAVASKLSHTLDLLVSVTAHASLRSLFDGDEIEAEKMFQSLELYRESVLLWGECIPLFYSSESSRCSVLREHITKCSSSDVISVPEKILTLGELTAFPSSEVEPNVHRLLVLCRRLRMSDLLDGFVSRPIPYLSDDAEGESVVDSSDKTSEIRRFEEPRSASSLIEFICDSIGSLVANQNEVKGICLALCHRSHCRLLLFDGFYAATGTELDQRPGSPLEAKALTTGDTIRVGVHPVATLQFDSTKCSDSIALLSGSGDSGGAIAGNCSAHQRASKAWGAVLSSHQYSPRTGVHRWAIKLDKCERGHVFIGVATSQTNTRTYVGGDKFGWGMIGTQALWHDRRKIRGDYGATFKTGSTVIVTLDTDVGTLSFSSWKDSSSLHSLSLDPLVQNVITPRRTGQVTGTVEDWGIAFEGLPLDSKLYPAVGLYQRDDRVTLLPVQSRHGAAGLNGVEIFGGACYFPRPDVDSRGHGARVGRFNDLLAWDGVQYAAGILRRAISARENDETDCFLVQKVLPSLASSLCLLPPSVPVLSSRTALILMPHVTRCINDLFDQRPRMSSAALVFTNRLREGKWTIRASGSLGSSSTVEEYVVDIKFTKIGDKTSTEFEGEGVGTSGKSKNGRIQMFGCARGSALTFIEDWADGKEEASRLSVDDVSSPCIVAARLSLDGAKFEGAYRNVRHGSTGQIEGVFQNDQQLSEGQSERVDDSVCLCVPLLCLAQSQLSSILSDDAANDLEQTNETIRESKEIAEDLLSRRLSLGAMLKKPAFSRASLSVADTEVNLESLVLFYLPPSPTDDLFGIRPDALLSNLTKLNSESEDFVSIPPDMARVVDSFDAVLAPESGGFGSLRGLCPSIYDNTRRSIIRALLFYCGVVGVDAISDASIDDFAPGQMEDWSYIWRVSLQILEDGVRSALSGTSGKSRRESSSIVCELYGKISTFLLSLKLETSVSCTVSLEEASSELKTFFSLVTSATDLDYLKGEMVRSSKHGILRLAALSELGSLLSRFNITESAAIESLLVGLPRLLGRGKADPKVLWTTGKNDDIAGLRSCLDGTFLFRLDGSNIGIRNALRAQLLSLLATIGNIAENVVTERSSGPPTDQIASYDSLVLTILTLFVGKIRSEDFDSVLSSSNVLSFMPKILETHRFAMFGGALSKPIEKTTSVCSTLASICQRDVSRAILRCGVAASHVLVFHASRTHGTYQDPCLKMLLNELTTSFPLVRDGFTSSSSDAVTDRRMEDWESWNRSLAQEKSEVHSQNAVNEEYHQSQAGIICLEHLRVYGSMLTSVLQSGVPRTKDSSLKKSGKSTSRLVNGSFAHNFLSHWLHIVCLAVRSTVIQPAIAADKQWLCVLLRAVGLNVEQGVDGSIDSFKFDKQGNGALPARFRARILRFVFPLLADLEPSEVIVHGFFELAGDASPITSDGLDVDDSILSQEAISLLRRLHLPTESRWRKSINAAISSTLTKGNISVSKKIGILSFFSGGFGSLGCGSFVLLKPAASSAVSPDQQSTSSNKNHPSGVGGSSMSQPAVGTSPHHVVGNGTEGILAGLCRNEASAGIVSNIDMKNAVCEVILLDRSPETNGWDELRSSSAAQSVGEDCARNILTVRALRRPLSDLAKAQEVPLYLDDTIAFKEITLSMFRSALDSLLSATTLNSVDKGSEKLTRTNVEERRASVAEMLADVLTIRCCIVFFSDDSLLREVLAQGEGKENLAKLLSLAWNKTTGDDEFAKFVQTLRLKSVASLPSHEARLGHLLGLLRDLSFRTRIFDETPDDIRQHWLEGLRSSQKAAGNDMTPPKESEGEHPSTVPKISGDAVEPYADITSNRSISQSTGGSNSEDEGETEAAATAAAHLREAAIAQMAELGLPRSWSELALRRTGGTNIEAAVTFCLERGPEIERLLAEEQERERLAQGDGSGGSASRRRSNRDLGPSNRLLRQLLEMGFPPRWCTEALAVTGNNVDEALTWILNNGERLSEEDEAIEADGAVDGGEEDDSLEGEEDDTEAGEASTDAEVEATGRTDGETSDQEADELSSGKAAKPAWTGSVVPLRFISGRAIIDPSKMEVSGLPSGGFSSVGTKGVLLTQGKWYYEAILETAGCLQIGWADGSFSGHCHAERGDGCGDGPSSWAFDGWRRYRWHATATEWGCRWKEGDVVGCLVDMDERKVSFTLNGKGECVGMGLAFSGEGFRPCGGVYACVSFNRKEKLRLILGGSSSEPFKYQPPPGYRGVGEAVLEAVKERDKLVAKEEILDIAADRPEEGPRRFMCDFSDSEHGHELVAWAHRYYGSDASVHLGAGRSKRNSPKTPSSSSTSDARATACLTRRLRSAWARRASTYPPSDDEIDVEMITASMRFGYEDVLKTLSTELIKECLAVAVLLSRKLVLHLLIAQGHDFNPGCLVDEGDAVLSNRRLWKVIEACTSLRNAGWVGEAGAMAVAAEALGLGISSTDQMQARALGERQGIVSASDLDEGVLLPAGGISQFLTCILTPRNDITAIDTASLAPASAEAAMCSDGGSGLLAYLQEGIQNAAHCSEDFRNILVAAVRRSLRRLAAIEYDGDDCDSSQNNDGQSGDSSSDIVIDEEHPDARLVSFVTGLLLGKPLRTLECFNELRCSLFEAWCVGLLSASLPWRMVCSFVCAGMLSCDPSVLPHALKSSPILERYFSRLPGTVARRLWAERAAVPVCSRYAQALVELHTAVARSIPQCPDLPAGFCEQWRSVWADAATPLPMPSSLDKSETAAGQFWESFEGWVANDSTWEVWTGSVEYFPVEWKTPPVSSVHRLMDGGDGPPMLGEGCLVMRGVDWDQTQYGNGDGKDLFDAEREEKEEPQEPPVSKEDGVAQDVGSTSAGDQVTNDAPVATDPTEESDCGNPADPSCTQTVPAETETSEKKKVDTETEKGMKKSKRGPSPKLPIGTVLSVEPWDGVPAKARRVRWNLTGVEGVYRFGGAGGKFDLCHVEVNSKLTRVKKRYQLPESSEQCASRHGFGSRKKYSVLLRLRKSYAERAVGDFIEQVQDGILEWPEFGAGVHVLCTRHDDGAITIEEMELLFGSKDSGWVARFGQPSFVSGSTTVLSPTNFSSPENQAELDAQSSTSSLYDEMLGSNSFDVCALRNPSDGGKLSVASEMRLYRSRQPPAQMLRELALTPSTPPPISFDRDFHAASLSVSVDGRTVSCASSDGRGTAFASTGFTKGVHYWEVKIEQTSDIGGVFIGVAEKPVGSGSGSSYRHDYPPKLNRWHGWGFVNFRATYASGAERVYGSHCHSGDTVGVLLDCDTGRVSFFFDGLKYGEHILNDLGCAFENISPFGFNVEGCGSGGAGQGAPSGFENGPSSRYPAQGTVRPRTLWPVIGLRNQGDRVTFSSKWSTSYGVDGFISLRNVSAVTEVLDAYSAAQKSVSDKSDVAFPEWFVEEAFSEYKRWNDGTLSPRSTTRGSGPYRYASIGQDVIFDSTPLACAAASAGLGLETALLAGDRVRLMRSAGRLLELAEEAVVIGAYQGKLYYKIASQKSEGGSLTEGGGRAWCWEESEVVDGLPLVFPSKGSTVPLPKLARFKCLSRGGLRVVYSHGAVLRTDLEIFEGSINLGTIPVNAVIARKDVLERRVNSCGVVRFRVKYEETGEGWISARIRGGTEEAIVKPVDSSGDDDDTDDELSHHTPMECAAAWYAIWKEKHGSETLEKREEASLSIGSVDEFSKLVKQAVIPGMSHLETDILLSSAVNVVSNYSDSGDAVECPFSLLASALSFAVATVSKTTEPVQIDGASLGAKEAAASVFAECKETPELSAVLARIALLRSFNRRAKLALPWLSIRPCQEGSAILGGLAGHGASPDRAGRSKMEEYSESWVQMPSIAAKIRSLRGLFFSSVKRDFLQGVVEATTTPTPLSHDEYELPREIRTVRINRLKAGRAMLGDDRSAQRKHSVYAQLQSETKNWGGAALRRGYVAKGHGGQKRAFKVKLVGEGVNDYSGPYREAFTDAVVEALRSDDEGHGVLGVLDPSPNNAASIGENRDFFMFSLNGRHLEDVRLGLQGATAAEESIRRGLLSLMVPRDEASREVEEALVFLGRIAGTAFRHGISLDLPLPLESVWKELTENPVDPADKLRELDYLAYRQLQESGHAAEESPLIIWQQHMLNSFAEGLSHVLPMEILPLLSGEELRDTLCGNPEVDVGLLKQVVEYEGYNENDPVVTYFWDTLNEMSHEERRDFLQFVWARNRLPMRESDFDAPFKIQKDSKNTGDKADQALPSASTCFFSLTLPEYSTQEILRGKLLFAINNVTTMETDFQTNSAEIAEGYRAF